MWFLLLIPIAVVFFAVENSSVLFVEPNHIQGVDLGLAQALHVLGKPSVAVELLHHETSSLSMGPLAVFAYRDKKTPFDGGAWRTLEAACSTVGATNLHKSLNTTNAVWPNIFHSGERNPLRRLPSGGQLPGEPDLVWKRPHQGKHRQLAIRHENGVVHAVVGDEHDPHHAAQFPCNNMPGLLSNYAKILSPAPPVHANVSRLSGVTDD